jgi:hypothetical protein
MSDKVEYSRLLLKRSTQTGVEPTVTSATTLNQLTSTDLLDGEMFLNTTDKRAFVRLGNTIEEFSFTVTGGTTYEWTTLDIGAWDMDNIANLNVPHGLNSVEFSSIVNLDFTLVDDGGTTFYSSNHPDVYSTFDSTNITLRRTNGGFFDSGNFSSTGSTRGTISFSYNPV